MWNIHYNVNFVKSKTATINRLVGWHTQLSEITFIPIFH